MVSLMFMKMINTMPKYACQLLVNIIQSENLVSVILTISIGFILLNILRTCLAVKSGYQPPGPIPLPIIGNLLHFSSNPHLDLQRLGSNYGKIMTVSVGCKSVVVLNDIEVMREAFTRKTQDFDGRADSYVGSLVSDGGNDLIFADYGKEWRMRRSLCLRGLSSVGGLRLKNLEYVIAEENEGLISRMLKQNGVAFDPHKDICLTVVNIISHLTFGCRYSKDDAEFLETIEYIDAIAKGFDDALGSIIDFFPLLKILPSTNLKNLKMALKKRDGIMSHQLDLHRRKNVEYPDFTAYLLSNCIASNEDALSKQKIGDKQLRLLMFDLFGAGVDTTVVAIRWAIVYLLRWPRCQKIMLKEIENLRPNKARIKIDDIEALPYCQAVVRETLRMCSLFPISPRKTVKNTELLGYKLKKGTNVIFNLWAANHDGRYWNKPFEFIPERFMNKDGKLKCLNGLSYLPFSAGRRSCPGAKIAEKEIFLILVTLIQHFEIKVSDKYPSLNSVPAVSYKPEPYSAVFAPR